MQHTLMDLGHEYESSQSHWWWLLCVGVNAVQNSDDKCPESQSRAAVKESWSISKDNEKNIITTIYFS